MGKCIMPQVFVIGGGGGDEPIGEGDFLVRFLDFDGTILKEKRVDSGGSVTPPTAPTHTDIGLTFQEWTHATNNVTGDIDVGATYYTTDGKTHFVVRSTVVTGKDVVLYLNKSDGSTLTVDWGDSTTSTFTNTGNFNTGTHTYTNYGDYTIKMWISSGSGTYSFANGSDTTTVVGGSTQAQRDMLLKMYVGDKVTSIGNYAFNTCYSLTSIVIPSSVTSIGDYAFQNCYSLTSIVIPNSVASIGNYAFYSCRSLTSIVIPNSVISIGDYAFRDCRSLTSIVIPNSVISIGDYAFRDCYSLTSIVIPNSVISIGDYAFYDCYSLTSIVIPNSVISIGDYAFYDCHTLTSIVIPNSVASIGNYAFYSCRSLTSIVIPNSVISIGDYAFYSCRSLRTYVLERTASITTIGGTNTFAGINSSTKIYVPDTLVSTYKSATNWSTYANYIYPISEKGVTHDD